MQGLRLNFASLCGLCSKNSGAACDTALLMTSVCVALTGAVSQDVIACR